MGVGIVLAVPCHALTPDTCHQQDLYADLSGTNKGAYGYNAANGEYGDMLEFGILDPTKVTRTALQNAASIAGLMITTEAMVAELPKKDEPAMPAGGGMGGMDF